METNVDISLTEEDYQGRHVLNQSLERILWQSSMGRSLLQYKNKQFNCGQRNTLIKIIVEEAISKNISSHIQDFPLLVMEIVYTFPLEKQVEDIYYIPRRSRGNPSGKLYCKYKNYKSKWLKFANKSGKDENYEENPAKLQNEREIEIDATIATALKATLNRDSADWDDVCLKWKKTFQIRRRDLLELDNLKFLQSWSKLSHAKAADLVNF